MHSLLLPIGLTAFCIALPLNLTYLATLWVLVGALKRAGVDLGSLFRQRDLTAILAAVVTNRYASLNDPHINRLTLFARLMLALGGVATLTALVCLGLAGR